MTFVFQDPIQDFSIPLKPLTGWFTEEKVTAKRKEIKELVMRLKETQEKGKSWHPHRTKTLSGFIDRCKALLLSPCEDNFICCIDTWCYSNNPPPPQPIVCDWMQEFRVKEKVNIFQIGDFGNLWQTFLIWMSCTFRYWGFVCATLYYIPFLNKFHSTLMQSKNTIFWKAPVHTCIFSVLFLIFL